ncbi:uncharacterized protein ARMOST_20597 [Armillaria ostoyae]|uniref:Reverse transcriptase zinc-binding domain-containing protein n=1 Tax=Armillaria ostoyae TaxID=47428 RepID=A0A284S7X6_ARMOS|nr:uncharacterized protein ARMOST_20597 [Armillaria ostoyae]
MSFEQRLRVMLGGTDQGVPCNIRSLSPSYNLSFFVTSLHDPCDVSIDIDSGSLAELERVQKTFIRRLLGIAKRSPVAMLFPETGMWPVKFRRLTLALRADAITLANHRKPSWMSDLHNALYRLRRPITILSRPWSPVDVDNIVDVVEQAYLKDIETFIGSSPKAPLLHHRASCRSQNAYSQKSVMASFRPYLLAPVPAHRKALVRLLTSSHTLAVEVLRWAERRRPPVPHDQRLCRCCQVDVEDEAHVLLYCTGCNDLEALREQFFRKVFRIAPLALISSLQSASSGVEVIRLLIEGNDADVLCSFAKFVFHILRIFQRLPVFRTEI